VNRFIIATLSACGLGLTSAFGAEPQTQTRPQAAPAVAPATAPATATAPTGPAADASSAEPAVQTSSAASVPGKGKGQGAGKSAPGKAADGSKAHDYIELETMQVTGNRELPNVMYVVPWKKPDLGDFAGRPPKSLLDEMLAPVDRDVFQRQNRYFAALQPDAAGGGAAGRGAAPAAPGAKPATPATAPAAPVTGPVAGPGSGDEK
jgi:hypothetical protein